MVLLLMLVLAAPVMAVPVVDDDGWMAWLADWWRAAVQSVFASSSTAPKDGETGETPDGGSVTTTSGENGGEVPPPCPTPTTCPEGNSSMDPDG